MNDDWPHPRELPQETLMLARIKTLLVWLNHKLGIVELVE